MEWFRDVMKFRSVSMRRKTKIKVINVVNTKDTDNPVKRNKNTLLANTCSLRQAQCRRITISFGWFKLDNKWREIFQPITWLS